jgi:cytochrome P450
VPGSTVPRLSPRESAGVLADVLLPLAARGAILRRPPVEGLLDRMEGDRRAVRRVQRVRDAHGPGPVVLPIPGREIALVLTPEDAGRVLAESPDPFALATREKTAALAKFQPHGVLITHGPERAERRAFNEAVLDTGRPHRHADAFTAKIHEEADALLAVVERTGALTWDDYAVAFWRIVRRVTFGDAAREEHELTDLLRRLRGDANWAYFKPPRTGLRDEFLARLSAQLDRAEPGSLAELVRSLPASPGVDPDQQVPQWLFAFDAAAMASIRALALIAAHGVEPGDPNILRATVLESIRLWPTTPAILRDTTRDTTFTTGTLKAGAGVLIFAPFFHRDDTRLPEADTFAPELWPEGELVRPDLGLVPFSDGPGICPGRDVVLLVTTTLLARLLERHRFTTDALDATKPLPGTLSPFRLTLPLAS